MTNLDLHRKLHDQPFKPFRIKMVNNTTYDVLQPWMIIIGDRSAIVVTQTRREESGYLTAVDWRTISIDHVIDFQDLDPKTEAQRRPA